MTFSAPLAAQLQQIMRKLAQHTIGGTPPTDTMNDQPVWEKK